MRQLEQDHATTWAGLLGQRGRLFSTCAHPPPPPEPCQGTFPATPAHTGLREFMHLPSNFSQLGQRSEEQGGRV